MQIVGIGIGYKKSISFDHYSEQACAMWHYILQTLPTTVDEHFRVSRDPALSE